MVQRRRNMAPRAHGVVISEVEAGAQQRLFSRLEALGLEDLVSARAADGALQLELDADAAAWLAPDGDTLGIAGNLGAAADGPDEALEREILASMLAVPYRLEFPSVAEFLSAVRVRANIVAAARKTQLAFDTEAIERPEDCWTYSEDTGFTVVPGCPLIEALTKATQPDGSGRLYAFSCYRATEYVILLALAQELTGVNPELLDRLQGQWERKAIMSRAFHEAFLDEHGSVDAPVPSRYYVPGDRVWFRNPDPISSDVTGYEGSWVFYLGGGLFSNFWKRDAPYTLRHKCVEMFHWRDGVRRDGDGNLTMDEAAVDRYVRSSLADAVASETIVGRMARIRDPQGIYAKGGCLDASRESPRRVHPETSDIRL